MEVIIVCHTEFGFVHDKVIIFDKNATAGVEKGVHNLIKIGDKYGAKITFAVMPEVAKDFPKNIKHEIGLHIHPGWAEWKYKELKWVVGDTYLRKQFNNQIDSTILRDYNYTDQLEMIRIGRDHLQDELKREAKTFVAGRWSINNDTVKALIKSGITHECSAPAHSKPCHHDWSKLPRICMPYRPSELDYQQQGDLRLLIVPISQMFPAGTVNPEVAPIFGSSWLKACFLEYYNQNLPLFHICLHSPCLTSTYFIHIMDNFLNFISKHENINFKFASEVEEYGRIHAKTKIIPYLLKMNKTIIKNGSNALKSKIFGGVIR